jgi:hypothetical protein
VFCTILAFLVKNLELSLYNFVSGVAVGREKHLVQVKASCAPRRLKTLGLSRAPTGTYKNVEANCLSVGPFSQIYIQFQDIDCTFQTACRNHK